MLQAKECHDVGPRNCAGLMQRYQSCCAVLKTVMIYWSHNIIRKELLTQKNYSTLKRKFFTLSVLQLSNVAITHPRIRRRVTRERVKLLG